MLEIKSRICFLTPRKLQPHYPLFIFLPGMDGTGHLLRTQTEGLETAFDVRCLAIPPDDLNDWDCLAAKVLDLIRAELKTGIPDRPVYLCGESFGGCLALKLAVVAPDLFKRVILVNPASSFHCRPWIEWGCHLAQWLPEPVYQVASVGLLPFLASFRLMALRDRQDLLAVAQQLPQKTSIWRLSLLKAFHLQSTELQRLTQPVLLIASANDRLLPSVNEARHLSEILPKAQIHVLPESGHACLLEAAVNLYELMKAHNFVETQSTHSLAHI